MSSPSRRSPWRNQADKTYSVEGRVNRLYANNPTVIKVSNQQVVSSTVLVNDTALFVPVAAGAWYEITVDIFGTWNASFGIEYDFALPGGASMGYVVGVSGVLAIGAAGTPGFYGGTVGALQFRGSLQTAGAGGTCQFEFAQHAMGATPTVVDAGSWMTARRLA